MGRHLLASWLCGLAAVVGCASVGEDEPLSAVTQQEAGAIVPSAPVGTLPGQLSVSAAGSARYQVPLWTPPGRLGVEPSLALAYDSRASNGLAGVGWSVVGASGSIERCRRTVTEDGFHRSIRFDDADALCLDGNRLVEVAPGEYRTRPDTFARIVRIGIDARGPTGWRVYTKSGPILTYGDSPNANLDAQIPLRRQLVRVRQGWLLRRVEDRNGNAMELEYERESEPITELASVLYRPSRIRYTLGTGLSATRELRFYYAARPDPFDARAGGLIITTDVRLDRIEAYADQALLRTHRLTYRTSLTGRSLLDTLTTCDGAGVCLPGTHFDYTTDLVSARFRRYDGPVAEAPLTFDPKLATCGGLQFTDIDGDGRDDLFYRAADRWNVRLGNGAGFGPTLVQTAIRAPVGPWPALLAGLLPCSTPPSRLYDLDGRGGAELLTFACESQLDPATGAPVDVCGPRLYRWTGVRFDPYPVTSLPATWRSPVSWVDLDGNGADAYVDLDANQHFEIVGDGGQVWAPLEQNLQDRPAPEQVLFRDLDGDGQAELLFPYSDVTTSSTRYARAHVDARSWPPVTTEIDWTTGGSLTPDRCNVFGDFNGDGLVDVRNLATRKLHVFDGAQFFALDETALPGNLPECVRTDDAGLRVVDVNGDGRQDMIVLGKSKSAVEQVQVYLSGRAGTVTSAFPLGMLLVSPDWKALHGNTSHTIDVNGDGQYDVFQMDAGNHYVLDVQEAATPDLLVSVRDGLGGVDGVDYASIVVGGRPMTVVVRQRERGRTGTATALAHAYAGPTFDDGGAGLVGFTSHTVTDAAAGTTITERYDLGKTTLAGRGRYARAGMPTEVETCTSLDGGVAHLVRTSTVYATRETNGALSWFAYPQRTVARAYEEASCQPIGAPLTTEITEARDVDDRGDVHTTFIDRGAGYTTTTLRTFDERPDWRIGLLTREVITATAPGAAPVTRQTDFVLDNKGQLAELVREPGAGPGLRRHITFVHDFHGVVTNVVQSPDGDVSGAEARATALLYDASFLYPVQVTDSLGHQTLTVRHGGLDVPLYVRDVDNGLQTALEHDGFGRPTKLTRPDGTSEVTTYAAAPGFAPLMIETRGSDGGGQSWWFDSAGREVQRAERTGSPACVPGSTDPACVNGAPALVTTHYDELGRIDRVTRPHTAGEPTYLAVQYEYDRLGRVRFRRGHDPATATEYRYQGLVTDLYDEDCADGARCTRRRVVRDAAGHIAWSAIYPDGPTGAPVITSFAHGPFDQLTQVTDARGNVVQLTYDLLGRRTRLDDPDLGFVATTYDAFDEVIAERRPGTAGDQVVDYRYDALGRLVTRSAPDGVDTFVYDTAAGAGVGRLASQSRGGIATRYDYDSLGRIAHEHWDVDGEAFDYDVGYDDQGRIAHVGFPQAPGDIRFGLGYEYDGFGALHAVRTDAGLAVWTLTGRDSAGHATEEQLGNGLVTTRAYQPDTGRLSEVATPGIPYYPTRTAYRYSRSGDVLERTTRILGAPYPPPAYERTETFTYDGADRLRTSTVAGNPTVTYDFDELDNVTQLSELDCGGSPVQPASLRYGEGGAGPHVLTGVVCPDRRHDVTRDPRGNTSGYFDGNGDVALAYTSFDKPAEFTSNAARMRYQYDADHRLVKKALVEAYVPVPTFGWLSGVWGTTITAGAYERRTGPWQATADHVFTVAVGGRTIAQRYWRIADGQGVEEWRYLHGDGYDSFLRTTDAGGAAVEWAAWSPWGRGLDAHWDPAGIPVVPPMTRRGFEGHRADIEDATVKMGARSYHAFFQRFLQPDPHVGDPYYGPSWNHYAFVYNNPFKYVDPTGEDAECAGVPCADPLPVLLPGSFFHWPGGHGAKDRPPLPRDTGGDPAGGFLGRTALEHTVDVYAAGLDRGVWLVPTSDTLFDPHIFAWVRQAARGAQLVHDAVCAGGHSSLGGCADRLSWSDVLTWVVETAFDPLGGSAANAPTSARSHLYARRTITQELVVYTTWGFSRAFSIRAPVGGGAGVLAAEESGVGSWIPSSLGARRAPIYDRIEAAIERHGGKLLDEPGHAWFPTRRAARQAASEIAGDMGSDVKAFRARDFGGGPREWENSPSVNGRISRDGRTEWRDDMLGHPLLGAGPHVNVKVQGVKLHLFYDR